MSDININNLTEWQDLNTLSGIPNTSRSGYGSAGTTGGQFVFNKPSDTNTAKIITAIGYRGTTLYRIILTMIRDGESLVRTMAEVSTSH